jgi:queuine tRNA-ribosyltransferase
VDPLSFAIEGRSSRGAARAGRLATAHGPLATPAFFPVGTFGAVRGISVEDLHAVRATGVLANTYHLHLRPGEDVVAALGGLHGFIGWRGPILTDSGGFQVHSLDHLATRSEDGVSFQSPLDGSRHLLTPERCIAIQEALGADLIVILDEFAPVPAGGVSGAEDHARARAALERTLRWADRCLRAHRRGDQLLFGISQGGGDPELRRESAERTVRLGFRAHAIGGLGLGEDAALRSRLLGASLSALPLEQPRYVMGIGRPQDLLDAIGQGVDLFDCVLPTRNGRHGTAFTASGPLHLRGARNRLDAEPIEAGCDCPACRQCSRAYLRHLLKIGEALGSRMVALHNLAFYFRLMREARTAILEDRFDPFAERWRAALDGAGEADAEPGTA